MLLVGEKEEQELAHEPGMIDVLKQGFSDVKEKLGSFNMLK